MNVLRLRDADRASIARLLAQYGIELSEVDPHTEIPGSYWGESEAGLLGNQVHVRADTPLHSLLHEASHFICMDTARRAALERDAGGDYNEENAVCYLQILLADEIGGFGRERMWSDMDAWGYTFRLGSARAWFEGDADDARQWLFERGMIDDRRRPTYQCAR